MAEIEAELLAVVEFDVGTDDGVSHPLSCHGIQVTPHACIDTKVLVELDVGKTAEIGGSQIGIYRKELG